MDSILTFSGVRKTYGGKRVLDGVNLSVERGEICGLVGANGAGKTTMMRLALSLAQPSAGTVRLDIRKKGSVGCLIECPVLDKGLTVRQNLEAHRYVCGFGAEHVETVIELMSLGGYTQKKVAQLSLGMKQKTALAQALMGFPEFVVLDEPVNGLDPQGVREVRERIVDINRRWGTTFLISSHIIDELVKVVSRCALLKNGVISFVEPEAAKIEQAFFETEGGRT